MITHSPVIATLKTAQGVHWARILLASQAHTWRRDEAITGLKAVATLCGYPGALVKMGGTRKQSVLLLPTGSGDAYNAYSIAAIAA